MIDLTEYAIELYSRRDEAINLRWAQVSSDEWVPQENDCHLNVTQWCMLDNAFKAIRGWLYFELPGLPSVMFLAHSVVQAQDQEFYDITPPNTIRRPPFIPALESEEEYEALIVQEGIGRIIFNTVTETV